MTMNNMRILHSPTIMMPADLASCLSVRQPLYQLSSSLRTTASTSPTQRLSPPINTSYSLRSPTYLSPSGSPSPSRSHSPSPTSSPSPTRASPSRFFSSSEPRSCLRREHGGLRKRVSFSDAKGTPLTAVRLFIPDTPSSPPTSPSYSQLPSMALRRFQPKQDVAAPTKTAPYKLRLAFTQPSLDLNVFMARQKEMGLQLESCSVSEYCLSGKIRVSHVGTEQTVHVRMSIDSWRSHYDIPCAFVQRQRFGSMETDIHAFELSLPMNLDPIHGIEFCVTSKTEKTETALWDDNRGQNYRIQVERDSSVEQEEVIPGSPKMFRYQPLPLLVQVTNFDMGRYTDLPHFRALSNLGAERGLCAVK
ncbi:hypothetical protein NL108_009072 [Boleophthalmus pectinirostris]|uniref:protein phosphatase 1 regulatory subunit 3C n=1 Tax=Boleophthalmus pectinirostris TaxID=150288 RepID=UPI00242C5F62|nr:protein phosphatase 1 regulatory subunit 3C [Boleophthalmus pectinirostris]KAJ0057460.1 hypothetical protein NL108_009072 [Boleophthalmus pectinirostris]